MSLESALRFLEESRNRPALQQEVARLTSDADYHTLCALAARYDYAFTPTELARAFAINWLGRWLHFRKDTEKSGDQDV
jgi:hypothetical protein